jgi:glycosyltransferase XagB
VTPSQKRATAAVMLSRGQILLAGILLIGLAADVRHYGYYTVLQQIVGLVTVFYVAFVGLKLVGWGASLLHRYPKYELPSVNDPLLPSVDVILPLHDEGQVVVEKLVDRVKDLRYPRHRLHVMVVLEEADVATQQIVSGLTLPSYFEVLVTPDAGPATKPKASNFAFMHSNGKVVVIFDAEDRPRRTELLHAIGTMWSQTTDRFGRRIGCWQARLSFWNPRESLVSTFYYAEYLVHFNYLRGLAWLGLVPPLGGTSNFFLREALDDVAKQNGTWTFNKKDGTAVEFSGPWDCLNPTEDADLAMRLAKAGWRVAMVNSCTYEEAPRGLNQARKQRRRWIRGYFITSLVHTRRPVQGIRTVGFLSWATFNLMMFGTQVSLLINPIMWALTILYTVSRLERIGPIYNYVHGLYPTGVFYAGLVVAIIGNTFLFMQKHLSIIKAQEEGETTTEITLAEPHEAYQQRDAYGTLPRLLLTPLFWAFTSVSAWGALCMMLTPSRRYQWDKTPHGHAMHKEPELLTEAAAS